MFETALHPYLIKDNPSTSILHVPPSIYPVADDDRNTHLHRFSDRDRKVLLPGWEQKQLRRRVCSPLYAAVKPSRHYDTVLQSLRCNCSFQRCLELGGAVPDNCQQYIRKDLCDRRQDRQDSVQPLFKIQPSKKEELPSAACPGKPFKKPRS